MPDLYVKGTSVGFLDEIQWATLIIVQANLFPGSLRMGRGEILGTKL